MTLPASDGASRSDAPPDFVFDRIDLAPDEFTAALPVHGRLVRMIPGPDRPDYAIAMLRGPLMFRPDPAFDPVLARVRPDDVVRTAAGSISVRVRAVVMAPRLVGDRFSPEMRDLWVNVAYVIDPSLLGDETLDLSKAHYCAIARLNLT